METNRARRAIRRTYKKQKVPHFREGLSKKGDDILSHITAVPSAQAGLTTLFGMGRGEPRRNNHLKGLVVGFWLSVDEFLQQLSTYQPATARVEQIS